MTETARSSEPVESSTATVAQDDREPDWSQWAGPDGELGRYVRDESQRTLYAWAIQPNFLADQAGLEREIEEGGYQHRQIIELLQNSADSLSRSTGGRIEAHLTGEYMYFSDDGTALTTDGLTSLMHAYSSPKQDTDEIGRFGLGFKSLLAISGTIDFFSKSVSLRFDREWSRRQIVKHLPNFESDQLPSMRLASPIDVLEQSDNDRRLRQFCSWATNIVRVKLDGERHYQNVQEQLNTLPGELLLLIDHVDTINVCDVQSNRSWRHGVAIDGDVRELRTGDEVSRWKVFKGQRNADEDEIRWAVPIDRRDYVSRFWAYFQTQVPCLVSGIVNARWRTGSDRSNLLENEYNNGLVKKVASLIADNLHRLSTEQDPAEHLDALPRQPVSGEAKYTADLRLALFRELQGRSIVPDGKSELRSATSLKYPPRELRSLRFRGALNRWNDSTHVPAGWLHPSAMTRERLSAIGMMFPTPSGTLEGADILPQWPLREWLEALTRGKSGVDAVEASRDAIQVAAMLDESVRSDNNLLGRIFRTRSNEWRMSDQVFLPSPGGTRDGDADKLVHDALVDDEATLAALKTLGVRELSKTERFRDALRLYLIRNRNPHTADSDDCEELWRVTSETDWQDVVDVVKDVQDYRMKFPVHVASGKWKPLKDVIWPGRICGIEDAPDVCVDPDFHLDDDMEILDSLGVWDGPRRGADISGEPGYERYLDELRTKYRDDVGAKVHYRLLTVNTNARVGPLRAMMLLPDAAKTKFTVNLLSSEDLFAGWTVSHDDWYKYESKTYDSYSLHFVRKHGLVSDGQGGIVRISDAGGHPSALRELVELPTWEKIKEAFGFEDPPVSTEDCEAIEPEDEELVVDVWPGLLAKIRAEDHSLGVVRCSGIAVRGVIEPSRRHFGDARRVYVVRSNDMQELESVNDAFRLELTAADIAQVLGYADRQVEARRREVRQRATDAERLLCAVGEAQLRAGLPPTLVAYKERNGRRLSGIPLAEAAIATYDSGTLKHYRQQLSRLNPPNRWAGGPRTIAFVRSLGFPDEWAGTRNQRRDAFVEVDGPFILKGLHDYQERVAERIVEMLQPQSFTRRGMLSLPTGAGKTRVAVEGTVRAMLEHGSLEAVLWVADRDELCEQAVQSWIQVWRCFGEEGTPLRVSRMWEGQPPPEVSNQTHVIVASIQTLNAKLKSGVREYDFIRDIELVVFDEAHRSIAPSFTNALNEIGFTPRQGATEPYLMGLTATPYRGHNDAETRWLVNRYGRNRLDDDAFPAGVIDPQDVVEHLQGKGILARARHEEIEGGRFSLTWEELAEIRRTNLLSRSAEDKIARDTARTERIIAAYDQHVRRVEPDAPTIIFATSVEHAMTLAAELSGQGVVARAVSGGTDRGTRRRIVDEFKRLDGEIKVLVNYGVFREGFDAPRTKVIIVARPVWSPNLYFQMIGRGLRGPENGGNDECLIINVRDNIENYERKLAFTEVDWLWDQ